MSMIQEAREGNLVRLTMTGFVQKWPDGSLKVNGVRITGDNRTYEILPTPLPSEPNTWWLDCGGDLWRVNSNGFINCVNDPQANPENYLPFDQLVRKESKS